MDIFERIDALNVQACKRADSLAEMRRNYAKLCRMRKALMEDIPVGLRCSATSRDIVWTVKRVADTVAGIPVAELISDCGKYSTVVRIDDLRPAV